MKESMFDGPEVLDKMLQDADDANRDPDEVIDVIDAKEAKEDAEELSNIMNDLKEQVGENGKDSSTSSEDSNNNVCEEKLTEDVPPKENQILSFEGTYNQPSAEPSEQKHGNDEKMELSVDNIVSTEIPSIPRYIFISFSKLLMMSTY